MASFVNSNRHICALKLENISFASEATQKAMGAALKNLPSISYIKLQNCFKKLSTMQNNPEHFFKALKLRGRPIRNLKMVGCYIGHRNLFNMIGLANRGYISEQLVLDVAEIVPERIKPES